MAKKVPLSQRRRCLIRPAKPVTGSASATASLMYSRLWGREREHGQGGNQLAGRPGEGGQCQERDSSVVPARQPTLPCHASQPTHQPTPAAQSPSKPALTSTCCSCVPQSPSTAHDPQPGTCWPQTRSGRSGSRGRRSSGAAAHPAGVDEWEFTGAGVRGRCMAGASRPCWQDTSSTLI